MAKKRPVRNGGAPSLLHEFVIHPFDDFLHTEAAAGILILVSSLSALILANSPFAAEYHHFLELPIAVGFGDAVIEKTIQHWINDGLMVIFFFLVGLEIKREMLVGELASVRKAVLPMAAALGGMIAPALFYSAINWGGKGMSGWAIPMATDIAFALGVIALLGRVPVGIVVFLTALAIVDDLGSVLVIALFYSDRLAVEPLIIGGGILAGSIFLNRSGVRSILVYSILGVILWLAFIKSGVHATIAGVLLAMTIPVDAKFTEADFRQRIQNLLDRLMQRRKEDDPLARAEDQQAVIHKIEKACQDVEAPLQRMERGLHGWVGFLIVPLFAFANAGVEIPWNRLSEALFHPITGGAIVGLVIGKQVGIMLFSWGVIRLGWGELPEGTNLRQIYGASWVAGIGFTMSLFIAELAFFDPEQLVAAKIGILFASLIAGGVGYFYLRAVIPARRG